MGGFWNEDAVSNFSQLTKHPVTGNIEQADWLDDHFGRHRYGVRFADGQVFAPSQIEWSELMAERKASSPAADVARKLVDHFIATSQMG